MVIMDPRVAEKEPLLAHVQGAGKRDPLLHLGNARLTAAMTRVVEEEGGRHHLAVRVFILAGAACTVFALTLGLFCGFYYISPLATIFVAVCLAMAGLFLSQTWREQRWHRWLGRFIFGAACVGAFVGFNVYYRHLVYYHHYRALSVETDVTPMLHPAQFANVGMVGFTADTRLDISRAVGYKSVETGEVVCVAPIIDSTMTPMDEITLYAAGVDCCAWRSQFKCGDALNPDASSGLLYLPPEQLVNPDMTWAINDRQEIESFKEAVKLQSAVFETKASEEPRFLKWTVDPLTEVDEYLKRSLREVTVVSVCFFGGTLLAAFAAAMGRKQLMKAFLGW